jgi:hypothetical protein
LKDGVERSRSGGHWPRTLLVIDSHGGLAQLLCENGDVIAYLEDKALAAGNVAPSDFP